MPEAKPAEEASAPAEAPEEDQSVQTDKLEEDINELIDEMASGDPSAVPVDAAAGEESDDELDQIASREACRPATGFVLGRRATEVGWELQEAGKGLQEGLWSVRRIPVTLAARRMG